MATTRSKTVKASEPVRDLSPRVGKPFPAHEVLLRALKIALKKGGNDMGQEPEAQELLQTLPETLGYHMAVCRTASRDYRTPTLARNACIVTQRTSAFALLKDGTFAQQHQDISREQKQDINMQVDSEPLQHAVQATFAPTLNELLLNGPPFLQNDWIEATVPAF